MIEQKILNSKLGKFDVWVRFQDSTRIKAGEIAYLLNGSGQAKSSFRYAESYLKDARAFPLDPISLPLHSPREAKEFRVEPSAAGVHSVFDSSLPDRWGRQLFYLHTPLTVAQNTGPILLQMLGFSGLGALAFGEPSAPQLANEAETAELPSLMQTAEQVEAGADFMLIADEKLLRLIQCGGSAGGARPKALVRCREASWIAKFPSLADTEDLVRLEQATMRNAAQAGLNVPETFLATFDDKDAFVIKRFDVTESGGRNHFQSFQSLLQSKNRDKAAYSPSYLDMAEILRQHSTDPKADLALLYRQMVFNLVMSNRDDHLKNFGMLRTERSFRLSPAYDILPNVFHRAFHALTFGDGTCGTPPSRQGLLDLAPQFNLSTEAAVQIIADVVDAAKSWETCAREAGVPEMQLMKYNDEILKMAQHFSQDASLVETRKMLRAR